MATDLVAVGCGSFLAYWLRFHSQLASYAVIRNGYDPGQYLKILPFTCLVWLLALRFENIYRRRSRLLDFNVIRRIVTGSVLALLIIIAVNYYHPMGEYSRLFTALMLPCGVVALTINRFILHYIFRWMMLYHGVGQSRTVILGGGPIAQRLYESLLRHPEHGMMPVGLILGRSQGPVTRLPRELPVLGTITHLEALLLEHHIDEAILTEPELDHDQIPRLLVECERALAVFRIVPDTTELLLSGMTVETLDGIPLLGIRETPLQGWNAALKRTIDFGVALVGLCLLSPLILILAWLVRRESKAPAFYLQERMGIDGRLFRIIKLRTMRPDAEEQTGPTFASDYDPRCTPLGGLLRRTHLDELPQLLNVLKGEMSLVGPRPERPYFIEQFREAVPHYMARHRVRSGITGWAQVNGLCGLHGSIPERLRYDLYYIENWSLLLDLKIVGMTIFGHVRPGDEADAPVAIIEECKD